MLEICVSVRRGCVKTVRMGEELRVQDGRWWVQNGGSENLLWAYRAWVLSSMGSPLVSCWPSGSGGRVPFSVASLSASPRIRGNSKKSYSRAPIAPPIIGPTQYTWKRQEAERCLVNHNHLLMISANIECKMTDLTQWLTKFLIRTAGAKDLAGFIPAPV